MGPHRWIRCNWGASHMRRFHWPQATDSLEIAMRLLYLFPLSSALMSAACMPGGGPITTRRAPERSATTPTLIGTWDVTRPERSPQVYEFKHGGGLVIKTEVEKGDWSTARGTWEISQATQSAYEVKLRYDGREEMLTINIKDRDTLTLSDWKGRDIVFRRKKYP